MSTSLELVRYEHHPNATIGLLTLRNSRGRTLNAWDALEPPDKDNKRFESSIPTGLYHVKARTYGRYYRLAKERWRHAFALAVTLPGEEQCGTRDEIRIHWGGLPAHTQGCIIVGQRAPVDEPRMLPGSRAVFCNFYDKVSTFIKERKVLDLRIEDEAQDHVDRQEGEAL